MTQDYRSCLKIETRFPKQCDATKRTSPGRSAKAFAKPVVTWSPLRKQRPIRLNTFTSNNVLALRHVSPQAAARCRSRSCGPLTRVT